MLNRDMLYRVPREVCEWNREEGREAYLQDSYHGKGSRLVEAPSGRFEGETIKVCVRCLESIAPELV